MNHWNDLYRDWLGAFAAIGTPAISHDTAARILAVTYVHGNNEELVYNKKYLSEIDHIKKMYHVDGGEAPDAELVVLIQQYVKELESERNPPQWAHKIFSDRYGIKLINY